MNSKTSVYQLESCGWDAVRTTVALAFTVLSLIFVGLFFFITGQ